jgi:hypothetical protein
MWDKEETQKLMQLGLTFEQAKIAVGRIAEHRQVADRSGYSRGFDAGWVEGRDKGREQGYGVGRGHRAWHVGE